MPTDPVTEARATIAEQEQRIKAHEESKAQQNDLGNLAKELETLPADAAVTIRVVSPATSKERVFTVPRDATPNLLAFTKAERERLEATS